MELMIRTLIDPLMNIRPMAQIMTAIVRYDFTGDVSYQGYLLSESLILYYIKADHALPCISCHKITSSYYEQKKYHYDGSMMMCITIIALEYRHHTKFKHVHNNNNLPVNFSPNSHRH